MPILASPLNAVLCGPERVKEQVLRSFFEGEIGPSALAADLTGAVVRDGEALHHVIEDMLDEFAMQPHHLVRVCDAFLGGQLSAEEVEAIGFCLVSSDSFGWNGDTPEGERVAKVVDEWSSPEINLAVTNENMAQWRSYLDGAEGRVQ